jgi:hypothetical protein
MLGYYNNIFYIEAGWLFGGANILSLSNYRNLTNRGFIKVVRRACKGNPALVDYESIPQRFKTAIVKKLGDPYKKVKHSKFQDKLIPDPDARQFFSTYKIDDGRNLPLENQQEYQANAEILNTIHKLVGSTAARRSALGARNGGIWQKVIEVIQNIDTDRYPHKLPTNERRLKYKYKIYLKEGYQSLIHQQFGNDNSRIVNVMIEQLLLSLYCLPTKPYANEVYEKYMQFLGGSIDVFDVETGELFNREDFFKDGKPITISEATVWNYINNPKNFALVSKYRAGVLEFNTLHRPHHHRHAPKYSLSKVSMDDRDLPRKMHDGKRVKCYKSYDVLSGCVIGASYSKHKTNELFIDCMRSMFRFIDRNNLGTPMEVEVEHHLVRNFKDGLMKAGTIFPMVRWSNPGNAQEKYAETMHRITKYRYEKRYQEGIGRFYARLEANRTHQDKVFDEENNTYKEKTYSYEEIVADDLHIIQLLNNDLHPNQKLYKGMTRLDVLLYKVNPNLPQLDKSLLIKYIGNCTPTTIRRSQYVRVQHENYQLPSPKILKRLKPNNYSVNAYWLADDDNTIPSVYIWQDGEFLCECKKLIEYNRATAEHTPADKKAYRDQAKYVSEFDAMIKQDKKDLPKVRIIENTRYYDAVGVEIVTPTEPEDDQELEYTLPIKNAVNSL